MKLGTFAIQSATSFAKLRASVTGTAPYPVLFSSAQLSMAAAGDVSFCWVGVDVPSPLDVLGHVNQEL